MHTCCTCTSATHLDSALWKLCCSQTCGLAELANPEGISHLQVRLLNLEQVQHQSDTHTEPCVPFQHLPFLLYKCLLHMSSFTFFHSSVRKLFQEAWPCSHSQGCAKMLGPVVEQPKVALNGRPIGLQSYLLRFGMTGPDQGPRAPVVPPNRNEAMTGA